jgi:hypothetical protein
MSIDANVLSSEPVDHLCRMYAAEYAQRSPVAAPTTHVPSALNALGACAGFAAQVAVWRELVLPHNRNPGDFLAYATTKSNETFFVGEAINLFLFSSPPDRMSFLTLAASALSGASELPDIAELARHTVQALGSEAFGRPRVPSSVNLVELPRIALMKTWGKTAHILRDCRPAEWPALLGAAAYNIVTSNRGFLAPPIALRILLEAAVPMSKLNPATVEQSGIPAPRLTEWSMRALRPENQQEIVAEVRSAMPAKPPRISARPLVIVQPTIAFVNLSGASCNAIVAGDSTEIGSLFQGKVQIGTASVPTCDVLFLYCDVEPSGKVVGQGLSLRDLIGKSGASVAVVASEVQSDFFGRPEIQKAIARGQNRPANLIITNNRNGEAFGRFFKLLFQLMWSGVPMPMAWVRLAPQAPQQPKDIPGTICLMEAGQVVFGTT